MHVVGQRFYVGKFLVGGEYAARVALALPCVVDVDVDVARIFHAAGNDLVGGVADVLVGDFAGEVVPAIPAHRRSCGHLRWGQLRLRRRLRRGGSRDKSSGGSKSKNRKRKGSRKAHRLISGRNAYNGEY